MQCEAAARGDDAGAETAVIAVDEGAAVAVFVGDGEVDGVTVVVCGRAVGYFVGGLLRVEEFGAFGEVGSRDHFFRGDFDDVGVCYEPGCVCEADAQSLDYSVEVVGTVVVFFGKCANLAFFFQFLEYSQSHESDDSLSVGWVLPYLDAVGSGCLAGLAIGVFTFGRANVLAIELQRYGVSSFCARLCMVS